ncbi:hypothetical protein FZEAL_2847 [Fusarium zealandicum]|uniref:Alkaline protease n=1 Tax=Fusarium zealandicum TaxID=1053134 RepID=A0A8H4UQP2_9HYPO|nr:hypothetical protein FZEAL_2847 [Fusarium zealandicum]
MVNFKSITVFATILFGCTLAAPAGQAEAIPGKYIITLKPEIKSAKLQSHVEWVSRVHRKSHTKRDIDTGIERTYDSKSGFKGYSGAFDSTTLKEIKKSPDVAAIEPDIYVKISSFSKKRDEDHVEPEEPEDHLEKRSETSQKTATWGLGTISHRAKGSTNYLYDTDAGIDSYAYVVDSGVRATHREFEKRAKQFWTAYGKDHTDRDGHGTHVAATIAGKTCGVAKKAQILAVKVFHDGGADLSIILSGINAAVNDIINKGRQEFAVINLSLGIDQVSTALNKAVENAVKAGCVVVVAAGNEYMDAGKTSPASAPNAITVGAVDSDWQIADFSNYGKTVDILAPGVGIRSASIKSDTAYVEEDGTSMATPHVSGLVLYAQSIDGIVGVKQTVAYLRARATRNKVTGNRRLAPNLLANNNNSRQ